MLTEDFSRSCILSCSSTFHLEMNSAAAIMIFSGILKSDAKLHIMAECKSGFDILGNQEPLCTQSVGHCMDFLSIQSEMFVCNMFYEQVAAVVIYFFGFMNATQHLAKIFNNSYILFCNLISSVPLKKLNGHSIWLNLL